MELAQCRADQRLEIPDRTRCKRMNDRRTRFAPREAERLERELGIGAHAISDVGGAIGCIVISHVGNAVRRRAIFHVGNAIGCVVISHVGNAVHRGVIFHVGNAIGRVVISHVGNAIGRVIISHVENRVAEQRLPASAFRSTSTNVNKAFTAVPVIVSSSR